MAVIRRVLENIGKRNLMVEIESVHDIQRNRVAAHDRHFRFQALGRSIFSPQLLFDQIVDANVRRPAQIDVDLSHGFVERYRQEGKVARYEDAEQEANKNHPLPLDENFTDIAWGEN